MSQYYLSYIEIKDHAALMLSQQDQPSGPAKIICELGFAYSPAVKDNEVHFYTRHKGHIREEANASRVLYGHQTIKHKTYEISEMEVKKFFNILNRDRNLNSSSVTLSDEDIELVGGPDYQQLKFNCKSYAIGVLKEIGIQDAANLKNYLVQLPGSKDSQLEDISSEDLSCPIKDKFIHKLGILLDKAADQLSKISENLSNIVIKANANHDQSFLEEALFEGESEISQAIFASWVTEGQQLAKELYENMNKAGYDDNFEDNFEQFQKLIHKISSIENQARVKTKNGFKKSKFDEIMEAWDEIDLDFTDLAEDYEAINLDYSDYSLEFFWKTTPTLSKRLDLQNFSAIEKMIYLKKIQSQDIEDNLDQILDHLDNKLLQASADEEEYVSDLIHLRNAIKEKQNSLSESRERFLSSLDKLNNPMKAKACIEQEHHEKEILASLEDNIKQYQPKSDKKLTRLMRFIIHVLQFFIRDYFDKGNSMNNWLNDRLSQIKPKSPYYDKNRIFSYLNPDQFLGIPSVTQINSERRGLIFPKN